MMKKQIGIWILVLFAGLNLLGQRHFTTGVSFDDLGRTATETYPDGSVVTYEYGTELNTPTRVTYQHAGGESYVFVEGVTFAPNGAIKTLSIPGGQQTWEYDAQERLTAQGFTYNGQTLYRADNMDFNHWGGLAGYDRADESIQAGIAFEYTDQEQLASFTLGSNTASFSYDAGGNLTAVDGFANHANAVNVTDYQTPLGVSYTPANRRPDWAYDQAGRVTLDDRYHYYYNDIGQVAMIRDRVTRIPLQTYLYDSDGNRVRTTDIRTGETTYSVRNGEGAVLSQIVDSADGPDRSTNFIFHNGSVVGKVTQVWGQPEEVTRMYRDHLGNPVVTIDDQYITHHEYAPFGQQMNEPKHTGAHGYTGHEDEAATGLVYMRARWQDPITARFMTPDPARDFDPYKPATYNAYQYVHNNPISNRDPSGEIIETIWDIANVGIGVASLVRNVADGNFGEAVVDGLGVIVDVGAVVLPGVPGGAGTGIKATRKGADIAIDAATKINKVDKAKDREKITEGIYEFIDNDTGLPYVGQSGDIAKRLKQHEKAGKIKPGSPVQVTEVKGGRVQREVAEHKRIRELTLNERAKDSNRVANKRDPIGPKREHLLNEQQ